MTQTNAPAAKAAAWPRRIPVKPGDLLIDRERSVWRIGESTDMGSELVRHLVPAAVADAFDAEFGRLMLDDRYVRLDDLSEDEQHQLRHFDEAVFGYEPAPLTESLLGAFDEAVARTAAALADPEDPDAEPAVRRLRDALYFAVFHSLPVEVKKDDLVVYDAGEGTMAKRFSDPSKLPKTAMIYHHVPKDTVKNFLYRLREGLPETGFEAFIYDDWSVLDGSPEYALARLYVFRVKNPFGMHAAPRFKAMSELFADIVKQIGASDDARRALESVMFQTSWEWHHH